MMHLMKLELRKVGLKKYIMIAIAGILISMYFFACGIKRQFNGQGQLRNRVYNGGNDILFLLCYPVFRAGLVLYRE